MAERGEEGRSVRRRLASDPAPKYARAARAPLPPWARCAGWLGAERRNAPLTSLVPSPVPLPQLPFRKGSIVRIKVREGGGRRGGTAGALTCTHMRGAQMHNFLTHTDAEMFPGPSLNLVIGPNGSGKSTITAAIVLALGFSTSVRCGRAGPAGGDVWRRERVQWALMPVLQVMERARHLSDFVKYGTNEGYAEVELFEGVDAGATG
jgi:hypothetical protein